MKSWKLPVCALLVAALLAIPLAGCGEQPSSDSEDTGGDASTFSYSNGIGDNGYWEGIKASDYVKLNDSLAIEVPKETYEITDEAVQQQIDSLLTKYATTNEIKDRAVADGDTVNIDYVGSVDGVEFEGGNTQGQGASVTIGETSYIDDFLEQLIGHTPGETFDVEVTFPDVYENNPDLAGKDAVFKTTINFIAETVEPELNDAFVKENLSEQYGWETVDQMKEGMKADMKESAINNYIQSQVIELATVESVPDSLIKYQEDAMLSYYTKNAEQYGMTLDDFLSQMKLGSVDELVASQADSIKQTAERSLIVQAIAEQQGITPTDEDVAALAGGDYSQPEEQYGMPYLKQVTMSQMVLDYLTENSTLAQ